MEAQKYCEDVDQKSRLQKKGIKTIPIRENNSPLVSLKESGFNIIFEPSIKKDYKYMVREAVSVKIGKISRRLNQENKGLIIRSVWRSFHHQKLLWGRFYNFLRNEHPNEKLKEIREMVANFVALEEGSMHSTGGAVDALIYDYKNDCIMDFGVNNGYKITLDNKCYPFHPDITPEAKKNRKLLIDLFEKEDFVCDLREFWHFDYGNVVWALEKGKKYAIYGIIPLSFPSDDKIK